ncbi:MAG: T9SS type A sorting domain-containing protein [Saprospiraceae bacterium]
MSKDKNEQSPIENNDHKESQHSINQDKKKIKEELNRRKALKTILGASSLLIINPFSTAANSNEPLATIPIFSPFPSASSTQTPTPTMTPTMTRTPTMTPSSSSSILPVELSEFGVREENGVIKLYWKTESETNNEGFEIQRSTNNSTFRKIGWVNGVGNSNYSNSYEFEEIDVVSNQWYYYRLKQIDFNGASEFSKTIAIMINQKDKITVKNISPNVITNSYVNIEISAGSTNNAEIFIHHINGQLITRKKVAINQGRNIINMNLSNAVSGMCVVNIKFRNGKSQTKRFIVQR